LINDKGTKYYLDELCYFLTLFPQKLQFSFNVINLGRDVFSRLPHKRTTKVELDGKPWITHPTNSLESVL
jgi:hypothetical protein